MLHGLKSTSASFRAFMAEYLHKLGYTPCDADNNVWMKPSSHPNGEEYYAYIFVYVDDILIMDLQCLLRNIHLTLVK